jgi:hypothetical protein
VAIKLKHEHKHILSLIARDAATDGWATVSSQLYPVISTSMPNELVEFEVVGDAGRVRLTKEGTNIIEAMAWL